MDKTVPPVDNLVGGTTSRVAFKQNLNKVYRWYSGGFIAFVLVLAMLEQIGLPRRWIGFIFLLATTGLYAGIGIMTRTNDAEEYYVAGRRVPAVYNGMATGADWMSAASFIGMAGTLYLSGYAGLAFIMGWTGGFCLVALFLAPYMRKFGQYTVPDFLGARHCARPGSAPPHRRVPTASPPACPCPRRPTGRQPLPRLPFAEPFRHGNGPGRNFRRDRCRLIHERRSEANGKMRERPRIARICPAFHQQKS